MNDRELLAELRARLREVEDKAKGYRKAIAAITGEEPTTAIPKKKEVRSSAEVVERETRVRAGGGRRERSPEVAGKTKRPVWILSGPAAIVGADYDA